MSSRGKRLAMYVLLGGFLAGLLDIVFALTFHGARGVSHLAILQSIASGLHGAEAFSGGRASAVEGLVLHFLMSVAAAAAYVAAASGVTVLARRPWLFGPLYGLAFWAVMTFVVVPLSAARFDPPDTVALVSTLLAHAFLFGLPIALVAQRAQRQVRRA